MPAYMSVKLAAMRAILATTAVCCMCNALQRQSISRISLSHLQQLPPVFRHCLLTTLSCLVVGNYKLHFLAPRSCCNFAFCFTTALLTRLLLFTTHAGSTPFSFLFFSFSLQYALPLATYAKNYFCPTAFWIKLGADNGATSQHTSDAIAIAHSFCESLVSCHLSSAVSPTLSDCFIYCQC